MRADADLVVVYANGVLLPEHALNLPEHTRLLIAIRRVETTPASEAHGRQMLDEIRRTHPIRLHGWRPTRDELHERR